jgi:hypothetical protein
MKPEECQEKLLQLLDNLDCIKDPTVCNANDRNCPLCFDVDGAFVCLRDVWEDYFRSKHGAYPLFYDHSDKKYKRIT